MYVYLSILLLVWQNKPFLWRYKKERRNNDLFILNITNRKGICKNCGDEIGQDSDFDIFCSEQCEVEYQMEHDRR